jgi:hypothetical protein
MRGSKADKWAHVEDKMQANGRIMWVNKYNALSNIRRAFYSCTATTWSM